MSRKDALDILTQMTREEKASMVTGSDFWHSPCIERLGLTKHILTDGPHGLRKQVEGADNLGINQSVPAACFPTAATTACSFDRRLMYQMGQALGDKCVRENVGVILGPGVNMKRNPLCGRNFEYFSEDPYLAGELAASMVNGIQSKGIGTSLKHFAVNTQETDRMVTDSVVDKRALHEIYLPAFETVVRKAQPWTVMCSYNRINGVYANTNKWLLTDLLREEWDYEGMVVSDWGAVSDKIDSIKAGMDLEMPGTGPDSTALVLQALEDGRLTEKELDLCVVRIVELILKMQEEKPSAKMTDISDNELARTIAAQSGVLLKNQGNLLPLKPEQCIAFIGQMAKSPRYQGAGSSKINAAYLDNAYEAAIARGLNVTYAEGYDLSFYGEKLRETDKMLIDEAVEATKHSDIAVVFAGLPDAYESEGFDRTDMQLPYSHNALIDAVSKAARSTIVVLQCGSPIELPWKNKVSSILLMYLAGQAGGAATIDLLTGLVNPSGKLAETWPEQYTECPSSAAYPGSNKRVLHKESIYIGYRYYDAAGCRTAFPFGYGLSYTCFEYTAMKLLADNENEVRVQVTVKNAGKAAGSETVQLYVAKKGSSAIFRAPKELKGFEKVYLEAGEEKELSFILDKRAFSYYNESLSAWCVEEGDYELCAASSSKDIKQSLFIHRQGDGNETLLQDKMHQLTEYMKPDVPFSPSDSQFALLSGCNLNDDKPNCYTINSTIGDIKDTFIGKIICKQAKKKMSAFDDPSMKRMVDSMLYTAPLRTMRLTGGMNWTQIEGLADMANGHYLRGIKKLKKKK